jgi:hypothetical protein
VLIYMQMTRKLFQALKVFQLKIDGTKFSIITN